MSQWEERFADKVQALRDRAVKSFECFAEEVVGPAFSDVAGFTGHLDFHSSTVQQRDGLRSFKFGFAENAYVLVHFRAKGVADVLCEHECFVPRKGQVGCVRTSQSLGQADRDWVDECFRLALDFFVDEYSGASTNEADAEVATV